MEQIFQPIIPGTPIPAHASDAHAAGCGNEQGQEHRQVAARNAPEAARSEPQGEPLRLDVDEGVRSAARSRNAECGVRSVPTQGLQRPAGQQPLRLPTEYEVS